MNATRSRLRRASVIALGALLFLMACQSSSVSPGGPLAARGVPIWPFAGGAGSTPAKPSGGAPRENLIVYTAWPADSIATVSTGYTRRTGVNVTGITIQSSDTVARLRAEATNPQADVWFPERPAILAEAYFNDPPLIEDFKPANADQTLEAFQLKNASFTTGVGMYPLVIYSNPRLLAELNLPVPTTYQDLADPRYRGRIVMPSPSTTGTGFAFVTTVLQVMGETDGWSYLERVLVNVDRFTPNFRTAPTMVAQGLYPIAIGFYDVAFQLRQEGYAVQLTYPEPVYASPWGAAVIRGARHAERAREYVAYLLTPEAQRALTLLGNYSVRSDVAPPADGKPISELTILDYNWSHWAQERRAVLARFDTLPRPTGLGR